MEEIIKRKPKDEVEIYERGIAYYKLKKYDKAIKDFDKVIKINKKFNPNLEEDVSEVYHNRGLAYQALGKNAEAEKDFAKAKELGYKV